MAGSGVSSEGLPWSSWCPGDGKESQAQPLSPSSYSWGRHGAEAHQGGPRATQQVGLGRALQCLWPLIVLSVHFQVVPPSWAFKKKKKMIFFLRTVLDFQNNRKQSAQSSCSPTQSLAHLQWLMNQSLFIITEESPGFIRLPCVST